MSRKTLIFGNGLGMALDPTHFSLTNAMADVWDDDEDLSDTQKNLISECLGGGGLVPEQEDQLDPLHQVISACKILNSVSQSQNMEVHWLSSEGQEFPRAVSRYIHKVATRLHLYEGALPRDFVQPLANFIRRTDSHVATLNYDRLLYDALIDEEVITNNYYTTSLVDGMVRDGFNSDAMQRAFGNTFGYYLHLHGSPLFYDDQYGAIRKRQRHELTPTSANGSDHIVLTHVRHKRSVIGASHVLSTYWDYLNLCLEESSGIVIVGYSGCDNHLNNLLAAHGRSRDIHVVEWSNPAERRAERQQYWARKLKTEEFTLQRLTNILDFNSWD
ncbi:MULTISPECIES: SIR2 family protein [unclassified Pseudomonas]|uniref:SIR2 family protein n=1 Tax=unclassified Pseudomonas TaxID=196821 RepID=UPI0002CB3598|nr:MULTISPECIES: SIR2 family protein [unclassified Pseudomonas]ENA27320.1 hypothetical protein HMPREF1487_09284 [Pseudomonas sp. HPB0071]MBW5415294.1 hypothetical protein [Pseudomonas sp. MAG002Y]